MSRLGDIQQINQLVSQLVLGLPGQSCIALVSLLWMTRYSGPLTIAALGGYLLVISCQLVVLPTLHRRTQALVVQASDNQGLLVEFFRAAPCSRPPRAAPRPGRNTSATTAAWPISAGTSGCSICAPARRWA